MAGMMGGLNPKGLKRDGLTSLGGIPCRLFQMGTCTNGLNCKFSHDANVVDAGGFSMPQPGMGMAMGMGEEQPKKRKTKTLLCRFNEGGRCNKGDSCQYAHGVDELENGLTSENVQIQQREIAFREGRLSTFGKDGDWGKGAVGKSMPINQSGMAQAGYGVSPGGMIGKGTIKGGYGQAGFQQNFQQSQHMGGVPNHQVQAALATLQQAGIAVPAGQVAPAAQSPYSRGGAPVAQGKGVSMCKFHAMGNCVHGEGCRYSHGQVTQQGAGMPAAFVGRAAPAMMAPGSGGGKGAGQSLSPAQLAPKPTGKEPQIQVYLDKTNSDSLGMSIDPSDGKTILVTKILAEGLVSIWNAAMPEECIAAGDRILDVNGEQGDTEAILEQLKKPQVLLITVAKMPPKPGHNPLAGVSAGGQQAAGMQGFAPQFNEAKFKTKMCKFALMGGPSYCNRGDSCPYAHAQEEIDANPAAAQTADLNQELQQAFASQDDFQQAQMQQAMQQAVQAASQPIGIDMQNIGSFEELEQAKARSQMLGLA